MKAPQIPTRMLVKMPWSESVTFSAIQPAMADHQHGEQAYTLVTEQRLRVLHRRFPVVLFRPDRDHLPPSMVKPTFSVT